MNEFELIARLTKNLPTNKSVVTGAGDDCAVLDLGVPDKLILFQPLVVWQDSHVPLKAPLCGSVWQEMQVSNLIPVYLTA